MEADDVLVLVEDQRSRPDQAHLAPEDVDQLGQLVQGPASQEATEACDARVVLDLEHARALFSVPVQMSQGPFSLLRVLVHRPELEDVEAASAGAHPLLAEEHGPGRSPLDPPAREQHERSQQRQREHGNEEIEGPLQPAGGGGQSCWPDLDEGNAVQVVHAIPRADDLEHARDDVHLDPEVHAASRQVDLPVDRHLRGGDDHVLDPQGASDVFEP